MFDFVSPMQLLAHNHVGTCVSVSLPCQGVFFLLHFVKRVPPVTPSLAQVSQRLPLDFPLLLPTLMSVPALFLSHR